MAEMIHRLYQRSYLKEAELLGIKDFPPLRRSIRNIMDAEANFMTYWKEEKLVGIIETEAEPAKLNISSLAVDPEFFRQGIGESLIRNLISNTTVDIITVNTAAVNIPALQLYQKIGFNIYQRKSSPEGLLIVQLKYS